MEGKECERIDACVELLDSLEKVKNKGKRLRMVLEWSINRPWKDCKCRCCIHESKPRKK